MTVQSNNPVVNYTGNGVTTSFNAPSNCVSPPLVILTDNTIPASPVVQTLVLNSDYTLTSVGGLFVTVSLFVAPKNAVQVLSILLNEPFTQLTHWVEGDPFPAASHEAAADHAVLLAQQLAGQIQNLASPGLTIAQILAPLASSAAGMGAALVAFLAPYVGAVAISLHLTSLITITPAHFGAVGDGVADDTVPLQKAILASVGITSLAGTPAQSVFELVLTGVYKTTATVFIPCYARIKGRTGSGGVGTVGCGIVSAFNGPILALGNSLTESGFLDIWLRDFRIVGDLTKASQVGIAGGWTGASQAAYPIKMTNVSVQNCGSHGIDIVNTTAGGQIINTCWDNVEVTNCKGYGVHIKVDVLNLFNFTNCMVNFCKLGGVFLEFIGSGTSPVEALNFTGSRFESCGINVGETAATDMTVGSFGFKSTAYRGFYNFDNCYFEGNGCKTGDATGAGINVKNAAMLRVRGGVLITSNNLIILSGGGSADIKEVFLANDGAWLNSYFLADGVPPGTEVPVLHIGRCFVSGTPTSANWIKRINSARTISTGFSVAGNSYAEVPERAAYRFLRDTSVGTATGTVGYDAVKTYNGIVNGSGGDIRLCDLTAVGLVQVLESGGETALFMLANACVLIAQTGTKFSAASGTALKINVCYNATVGTFAIENRTGSTNNVCVRFHGLNLMPSNDIGTYETRFQ